MNTTDWERLQDAALGCSFEEYAECFLVPLQLVARRWSGTIHPILFPQAWKTSDLRLTGLYRRWFEECSLHVEDAVKKFASRSLPGGLYGLPGVFFRTPFVRFEDKLVGISPWHVRDHGTLGTWSKLNRASKTVFGTTDNQRFSSTFGYLFEQWCADSATAALATGRLRDRLLLPSYPGAADEVEDVVFQTGDTVALISAKASLVPEDGLKAASGPAGVMKWLRRFLFEGADGAKKTGYRAGAVLLLDGTIRRIREGAYEARGISRAATVLPAVLSFDQLGATAFLSRWVESECHSLGILSARPGVRPLTIMAPRDYELLLALGTSGLSICDVLLEKTCFENKWAPLDHFLYGKTADPDALEFPGIRPRLEGVVGRSKERLLRMGIVG